MGMGAMMQARPEADGPAETPRRLSAVTLAGIASITAGVIHAAAIGSHAELIGLSRAFTALAITQVLTGVAAIVAATARPAMLALAAVNLAAVTGWMVTQTVGIGWISGLETPTGLTVADTTAAFLAAGAAAGAIAVLWWPILRNSPLPSLAVAAVIGIVAIPAISDASSHGHHDHGHHDHGHGDGHGDEIAGAHGHGDGNDAAHDAAHDTDADHDAHQAVVPPTPYDPELPIDLSGVEGVTPQQQAFAENLVAVTLRYLPQWEDHTVAEAAGFASIGDGGTGHEHFIQWDWIDDDVWLDPNYPESLVYEPQPDGSRRLVSAMYMLPPSMTLDEVPDWGGPLMQWHIHDDLCYSDASGTRRVAAVIEIGGTCPDGLIKPEPAPMIHVWIRPHECGPFAALDGVGAGQVLDGEEHFCNHVHGAHG